MKSIDTSNNEYSIKSWVSQEGKVMFDSGDVRRAVTVEMFVLGRQGQATSEGVVLGNFQNRLAVAREEIWSAGSGNGTWNVNLDCTGCRHVSTCSGDTCRRKEC